MQNIGILATGDLVTNLTLRVRSFSHFKAVDQHFLLSFQIFIECTAMAHIKSI